MGARLTSSSGVTGARDQSLESSQSDWSTKFRKLFLRVAGNSNIGKFRKREKLSDEKFDKDRTVESDLNQIKKTRSLL